MRDFTVSEVLEYSRNIEMESYNFYKTVSTDVSSPELKELALELAEEELKHFNLISTLLDKGHLTSIDMDHVIQIKNEDIDHLVATKDLPVDPTTLAILETAYNRELRTESIYRTLLSFTDLAKNIIETFSMLVAQERGHATRIKSIMNKYIL
ncbi:MAG: hypothetical protein KAS73_04355 [Candidatus Sabulitectum sp.]|nr:hypothetical protein [Candidatus Sabulitectum sp.]